MKARRLLENSTFDPAALNIVFHAFDAAWADIAHHFDPDDAEQARQRLAHATLVLATGEGDDPTALKNGALQIMAMAYRDRDFR